MIFQTFQRTTAAAF